MRAWNVVWGQARSDVVIENSYATIKNAVISAGDSEIVANGQFSLGYPRRDGGEEINTVVRMTRRPMADLKHAFELDDYDMDGVVSGEYHVYGHYETPLGFGRLLIDNGIAYGETFDTMTSALRFEGNGRAARYGRHQEGHRDRRPARPGSAGTAPTRSTSTAGAFRLSR